MLNNISQNFFNSFRKYALVYGYFFAADHPLNKASENVNAVNPVITENVDLSPIQPWQFGFQEPHSPMFEGLVTFHDDLMIFLSIILGFVVYTLFICIRLFSARRTVEVNPSLPVADAMVEVQYAASRSERLVHASVLETIWTVLPGTLLVFISLPSFGILYSLDEMINPFYTFKVIGHQWYWSYEWLSPYTVYAQLNADSENTTTNLDLIGQWSTSSFDSYMLADDEVIELINSGNAKVPAYRLLSVDNYLYLPTNLPLRALVSSSDVLHSWAIPSLGVKVDACPGRLNQVNFLIQTSDYFFGQCSEICGVNHGFMPIGIFSYDLLDTNASVLSEVEWDGIAITFQSLLANN